MNFLTKLGRFAMFVLVVLAGAVLSLVWAELAGGVIFALVVGLFSKSLAETLLHSQIAILATGYITILCGWLIRRAGKRKCDIDDEIKTVSDIKILKPPPRTASMERWSKELIAGSVFVVIWCGGRETLALRVLSGEHGLREAIGGWLTAFAVGYLMLMFVKCLVRNLPGRVTSRDSDTTKSRKQSNESRSNQV